MRTGRPSTRAIKPWPGALLFTVTDVEQRGERGKEFARDKGDAREYRNARGEMLLVHLTRDSPVCRSHTTPATFARDPEAAIRINIDDNYNYRDRVVKITIIDTSRVPVIGDARGKWKVD